jgi:hypothetical protein
MAKQKSREKKEFLIAQRDKVGPGYLNTPVWIIQKAGKRIWNRRQKRNWKQTEFGDEFRKLQIKKADVVKKTARVSGKKEKSSRRKVRKTRNTVVVRNPIKKKRK